MTPYYQNDLEKILITEQQIVSCVKRIAREIEQTYAGDTNRILMVGILKGSVAFLADLMKEVRLPLEMDFMKLSSYGRGTESAGQVTVKADLSNPNITDCDILVVEDILDTGNTLHWLLPHLRQRGARSVRVCALLNKPARRQVEVPLDFVGFDIPDEFVVGYGLDFNEKYRNMPCIGVLKPEIYQTAD